MEFSLFQLLQWKKKNFFNFDCLNGWPLAISTVLGLFLPCICWDILQHFCIITILLLWFRKLAFPALHLSQSDAMEYCFHPTPSISVGSVKGMAAVAVELLETSAVGQRLWVSSEVQCPLPSTDKCYFKKTLITITINIYDFFFFSKYWNNSTKNSLCDSSYLSLAKWTS